MSEAVELKPAPELVEAVQNSEDGSTVPPEAEDTAGVGATRQVRNRTTDDTQQGLRDLQGQDLRRQLLGPDRYEKDALLREQQKEQLNAQKYDRSNLGAGRGGRGDLPERGMLGLDSSQRKEQR